MFSSPLSVLLLPSSSFIGARPCPLLPSPAPFALFLCGTFSIKSPAPPSSLLLSLLPSGHPPSPPLPFQCLYVRVLVDLGGAQWVSSVDGGGWRGADVGLVGKLGWILTRVDGGRRQDPGAHAHGDLVDDAGWVGGVLHGVTRRALGGHQVGHGASGAQGGGRRVGVEVGLGGEVGGGGQVRVHGAVAGAVVWEGVWRLGHRGGDVGLLPSVAPRAICGDVLLSLEGEKHQERAASSELDTRTHAHPRERPRGAGAGERRERRGVRRRARWGGGGGGKAEGEERQA